MGFNFLAGTTRDGFATVMPGKLRRADGGAALTRCSAGWAGTPGMFTDATLANVRGFVDGVEVPIAVTGLRGKHPDGSYRAIGVQVRTVASFVTRAFRLEIWSTARSVGNTLTWIEPTQVLPGGEDATDWPVVEHIAYVACTDPEHLCDSYVALQPLTPATEDVATVAAWRAEMVSQWTANVANGTGDPNGTAIYDHALGCLAYYCRTGDLDWYEWGYKWGAVLGGPPGNLTIQSFDYMLPSVPGSCTGNSTWNPENLTGSNGSCGQPNEQYSMRTWSAASIYWTTAWRQPMRSVAVQIQDRTYNYTSAVNVAANGLHPSNGIRFNFGRGLNLVLAGYLLECTTTFAGATGLSSSAISNYPQLLGWVMDALEDNEYALGDYRDGMIGLKSTTTDTSGEGGTTGDWQNFQVAVVCEFLMMYYDLVEADTRIPTWLTNIGNILAGQTRASAVGEPGYPNSYVTPYVCTNPVPASGLHGYTLPMHAPLFGWLWAYTGNTAWRDLCDNAMVPDNLVDVPQQTKIWGELFGGTRQAAAYYRNGGTIRGFTGVHGTGAVQPTTHATLG